MARGLHAGALLCSQHRGCGSHRTGCAKHEHTAALERHREMLLQRLLDARDGGGRGGEGAAWVGEYGNFEWRHHRLFRGVEHFERGGEIAPANEKAGAPHAFWTPREDRVLRESGDVGKLCTRVRYDRVIARVVRHVYVEGACLRGWGDEMQNGWLFHGSSRRF